MQASKNKKSFLKYSSLGLQMIGTLLLFTWLGRKGDEYFSLNTPWLTILAMLLGLAGILYKIVKDFSKHE